ncbi:MAG: hypothetical protein EZS28_018855 [Streblomastix strix]|uniref:Uncharacterized protein n=1 Tax=Streblomastix strix TaxID=222440 RepID=A0A5J4VSN1_9EUKA|nr:MAG: hypothetical protein EZS28_018855 [Streblomastix strix]
MNQQQLNAHRDFWAQRSYTLRYLGLRSNGEYPKGFEEGLLDVSIFIQNTLDMNIQQLLIGKHFEEKQIRIYSSIQYDKDRKDTKDHLDLGRDRKRRRVISSECSGNGQNNEDWPEGLHCEVERQQLREFRIRRNR